MHNTKVSSLVPISGTISSLKYAFRKVSSSLLKEDLYIFLSNVYVSPPLIFLNIEETSLSFFSFLEQEDSSFDIESFEDRLTTEYVLSNDCIRFIC